MIFFLLIANGLATWRISSLILYETGPFRIFLRIRTWIGVYKPGEVKGLRELFSCMWCLSVWVAAGLAATQVALGWYALLFIPTSSAIALFVDKHIHYGRE